jgi:NADH-quinone oxidoreductase subunit L
VGATLLEHPHAVDFSPVPLITSLVVALGGLAWGYAAYRGYARGAVDPAQRVLGPVYGLLRGKYYVDEAYERFLVRPFYWISETLVSAIMDRGIIDGTLHFIGRASLRLGEIFRTYFDTPVVNGFGDLVANTINRFGHSFRVIQTGRVQQYLLVLMAVVVVVGAVLLLPGLGR